MADSENVPEIVISILFPITDKQTDSVCPFSQLFLETASLQNQSNQEGHFCFSVWHVSKSLSGVL